MHTFARTLVVTGWIAALAGPCQASTPPDGKLLYERAVSMPRIGYGDMTRLLAPAPDIFTSALTIDVAGFDGGMLTDVGDGNDAAGKNDVNLRVLPSVFGYWLVGYHTGANGAYQGFISAVKSDGTPNTPFGTGGKLKGALPFYPVDVANIPLTNKFYFIGAYQASASSDYDFGVYCLDGSTGGPCAGFGNNGVGLSVTPVDSNGFHNDFPVKIAYSDNAFYIVGTSDSVGGLGNLDVSVVAIDSDFGSPLAGFGNRPDNPGTMVFALDNRPNGVDRSTNLLVTTTSTNVRRLYVTGQSQRSATNDSDGFVLALDATTGARVTGFGSNGVRYVYADLGVTNKQDELDAITKTRDGQLVVAGHSRDDNNIENLLLGKFTETGAPVTSFCGGGSCASVGLLTSYDVPVSIVERTATRDLVVGATVHDDFGTGADGHPLQAVMQLGSSGNQMHAVQIMDFPALSGVTPSSPMVDMIIDQAGRVVASGTRLWDTASTDYDMTVTRLIDTDTIFANQFETVL